MRILVLAGVAVLLSVQTAAQPATSTPYSVAYASFGPLNSAIYVANADGSHERLLIGGSVLDMNPSFSPDGQSVVFTSRRHGSADIYRVRLDGSGLERLTDHAAFDDQAVVSPDGRSLVFVSSRSGQADLWVLDLASRRVRNLTDHPAGDYRPAWSPDGQSIAFTSDRDSAGARAATPTGPRGFSPPQTTELYVIRTDGSDLHRLTDGESSVGGAAWSPDGRRIAYYEASAIDWRAMSSDLPGPSGSSQIVALDLATRSRAILTSGPGRKYAPKWIGTTIAYTRGAVDEVRGVRQRPVAVSHGISFTDGRMDLRGAYSNVSWSPDGRFMVFHRAIEGTWPPMTPTFSRDSRFRTVRSGVFPSFSPDGRFLASNTAHAGIFKNSIVVMNVDGTNRRVLFDHPTENALSPAWSPAGDRIAFGTGGFFAAARGGSSAHIGVIGADGTGLRMLTSGTGNYGFPSWSPDGTRIVARATGANAKHLVVIDAATGDITPLTSSGPHSDNFPAWSPKGDRILFASDRDGDWELYSIAPDGRDLRRLTASPGNDAHASWSHDGEWIAFASARAGFKDELPVGEGGGQGAGDIFVMRWDGSDVRQLTDDAFEEATPAFAPTGAASIPGTVGHAYKSTTQGELRLHVFSPAGGGSNPRAAILFFFGGRWTTGSTREFVPQAKYLAERGMVAIVVDYRVFDRHATTPFEAMADAKSAIRWVRSHAPELGVDPARIVASGGSSGGHLAISAAVFDRVDDPAEDRAVSSKPDALVLFNPVTDTSKAATFAERAPGREQEGSPYLHMTVAIPPTLILHGRADSLPIESVERFCEKARQLGSRCDVIGYDGAEHGFFSPEIAGGKWYRETLVDVDRFLTALGFLPKPE